MAELFEKATRFIRSLRKKHYAIILVAIVVVFGFCTPLFTGVQTNAVKETEPSTQQGEAKQGKSHSEDENLGDLGDDNLVNVQQTPDNSFLYDTTVADLCGYDASYQKNVIQTKGEVVGDPIKAEQNPGHYWITLNEAPGESEGSLSVLVDESSLNAIDTYGCYGKQGTIIRVKGVFHVACTSHEGIIDIHADTVTAVEPGFENRKDFDITAFYPGLFMCALGAFLAAGYRMLAEGER